MATSMLTLQITKRADGRFITKRIHSADDPLGVDSSLNQALGTAVREATRISKEDRCRVAIDVETATGNFRRDQIINPPLRVRRNPRPTVPMGDQRCGRRDQD
jgi:hypothetical protein